MIIINNNSEIIMIMTVNKLPPPAILSMMFLQKLDLQPEQQRGTRRNTKATYSKRFCGAAWEEIKKSEWKL